MNCILIHFAYFTADVRSQAKRFTVTCVLNVEIRRIDELYCVAMNSRRRRMEIKCIRVKALSSRVSLRRSWIMSELLRIAPPLVNRRQYT